MFANAAQLAFDYGQKSQSRMATGFNHDVAFELISRIRQLGWIYDQITALEREFWSLEEKQRGREKGSGVFSDNRIAPGSSQAYRRFRNSAVSTASPFL
jgi:hypothetical protein